MKLHMGTGPMGVSAVKVSSSSWSWALEMRAEKLLGFHVSGAGGPARTDGREFARVFIGLGAVELLGMTRRGERGG